MRKVILGSLLGAAAVVALSFSDLKDLYQNGLPERYDVRIIEFPGSYHGVNAEAVEVLNKADANDEVHIHVSSPGGAVFQGAEVITAIDRSRAHVVAHVKGIAASMGSLAVAAADEVRGTKDDFILLHRTAVSYEGIRMMYKVDESDLTEALVHNMVSKYEEEYRRHMTDAELKLHDAGGDVTIRASDYIKRKKRSVLAAHNNNAVLNAKYLKAQKKIAKDTYNKFLVLLGAVASVNVEKAKEFRKGIVKAYKEDKVFEFESFDQLKEFVTLVETSRKVEKKK